MTVLSRPRHATNNEIKISVEKIDKLMTGHIFGLTQQEVMGLAFILDIKISEFKKTKHLIEFMMDHQDTSVFVRCYENSNVSIGRSKEGKNGFSGLTSWGGVSSFAASVQIMRHFFSTGWEIKLTSDEKIKVYGNKEDCEFIVWKANDLVEAA